MANSSKAKIFQVILVKTSVMTLSQHIEEDVGEVTPHIQLDPVRFRSWVSFRQKVYRVIKPLCIFN